MNGLPVPIMELAVCGFKEKYRTIDKHPVNLIVNLGIFLYNRGIFCKVFNEQTRRHGMTQAAVTETIRICKDRNVLRDYLRNREKEVVTIMMSLFDEEQIMKIYTKDVEKETERKTAERMIKDGELSLEKIARYVPMLSMDELKELEAEFTQLA